MQGSFHDDVLNGNTFDNILDAGGGDDYLAGGGGSDLYAFGRNDGHDTLSESGFPNHTNLVGHIRR